MNQSIITPLTQHYSVDFSQSNNNILSVKGMEEDGYSTRFVEVSLLSNGMLYSIPIDGSVRAIIRGTKPDRTGIFNECEILDQNTVRFEITPQMAAVPGRGIYEISVSSLEETEAGKYQTITSYPFYINIHESAFHPDGILSSDEFGLLTSKINIFDKLEKDTNHLMEESREQTSLCESAASDSIAATAEMNHLHDAVTSAEEQRISNEEQRQLLAAEAIRNADSASKSADTASASAHAAANAANEAAANAEKAAKDAVEALEQLQSIIGIDDTKESLNATWSSAHIEEVMEEKINSVLEAAAEDEVAALFS